MVLWNVMWDVWDVCGVVCGEVCVWGGVFGVWVCARRSVWGCMRVRVGCV